MNCIIIGDKFQKRMKSKGCVALTKYNNATLIEHQQKIILEKFPTSKIVYIYGFDNKKIESFQNKNKNLLNINFIYNSLYLKHNNAYSLYLAKNFLKEDCLIFFGDKIFGKKTFDKFDQKNGSQVFLNDNTESELGCVINDTKVENISYHLNNKLSEIYFLTKPVAIQLYNSVVTQQFHQCFVFEMINKLIDNNCVLQSFLHK